ncbi:hypothetical protein BB737_12780 [Mycobacterium avium subsp. hominissuis]|uniref:Uncharacterized protein n=3 Tax=Mycobacteriaceae TaxID=1762 RepID=A0A1X1XEB6_9MYCO|nr:hypothetical protein [Mycobacterium avium subsp. hominissuis]ORV97227.1 hypothetical protein AWC14_15420 [Mycobacterium kyorinense]PBJ40139.1 hypothetical protein XV03_02625 [Mycobacterium avium subsp. hominissuis]PBJ65467.1 hypothetical protein BB737_12780 [Mycobacterium avium subsp. hominissuis]QWY65493.1 hypothetical protein BJP78_27390 [Mycobacterium avium subsp. hominissuis]
MNMTDPTPVCIVQGCKNPVATVGDVCADCQELFKGYMVHNPDGHRATETELAAAQATLQRAHAQQIAVEIAATQNVPVRRANQLCWLCEQRRTCTQQERGWECDKCLQIH